MNFVFYLIIFPDLKKYCGITTDFKRRVLSYKNGYEKKRIVGKAIEHWGFENIIIQKSDGYADWNELVLVEKMEIKRHNTFIYDINNNGYNATRGGDGVIGKPAWNKGVPRTQETKEKISIKTKGLSPPNKGKSMKNETKLKISLAKIGVPSLLKGRSSPLIGSILTENHKNKISISNKGKKRSEEMKNSLSLKTSKKYHIIAPDNNEFCIIGLRYFCMLNNLDHRSMSKVARGKYSHHKGYKCFKIST